MVNYSYHLKNNLIITETEKSGFRGKVNAKCIECQFDPMEQGSWQQQIENCGCKNCPLFEIRPRPTNK